MTKGWYNDGVYQVSNVPWQSHSFCFSHLIGRTDSLLVGADQSGWEGEGKAVLSPWLAEGVGRETRERIDARDRNILQLSVLHFDTYISWKLLLWQVSFFYTRLHSIST